MPNWLVKVLRRIHDLAAARRIRLTYKANREAAAFGLDVEDVRQVLAGLTVADSDGRRTTEGTDEWLYVFKPQVGGATFMSR